MAHAVRLGLRRGWTEFVQSLRSTQDQGFYLFTAVLVLGYLWLRRDTEVEGTDLLVPSVALPSILGALVAFGVVIGPAYALAMEREDGTLLRRQGRAARAGRLLHRPAALPQPRPGAPAAGDPGAELPAVRRPDGRPAAAGSRWSGCCCSACSPRCRSA